MTIKVGEKIPAGVLMKMGENGPEPVDIQNYFAGSKVVVFAVPGAFTPTCSARHLPGFIQHADDLKAKGVDKIACVSVNDAFVMDAWGKSQQANGVVDMLADGSAKFTTDLGLELDLIGAGLGMRSQRFAMIVEDGTVTHLAVDASGAFEDTAAEAILKHL